MTQQAANNQLQDNEIEAAKADIVGVIERYVKLDKKGTDYTACCPFHSERTPSFTVSPDKGFYHCFGCGAHGDAVDFVREYEGLKFPDAVRAIIGSTGGAGKKPKQRASVRKEPAWKAMRLVPADAPAAPDWHKRLGKPSSRWEYRDTDGKLAGYAVRFDLPGGGKDVVPQCWRVNTETGEQEWGWMAMPQPRLLYGAQQLAANPGSKVLVVEGEKTADAARGIFKGWVVVSWPGGGNAAHLADWHLLRGRSVVLWPDWDWKKYPERHELAGQLMPTMEQPGVRTMRTVYEILHGQEIAKDVRIVPPMADTPDGWDLADPAPVADFNAVEYAKGSVQQAADYFFDEEQDAEVALQLPPAIDAQPPANDNSPDVTPHVPTGFTVLGYDRDEIYVFPFEAKQIKTMGKADMSETGLLAVAPREYWQAYFPKQSKTDTNAFDKAGAVDWLFRKAYERGVFNPNRIRGRGAWRDSGRIIFHLGDRLHVDGNYTPITNLQSQYIYQAEQPFPRFDDVEPLTAKEGADLLGLANMFRWSVPASAALLAGWCVLAPVCGALQWRPHVWITGGPGSGKSTVVDRYVRHLVGDIAVFAQGNSSEAGIRQTLRGDALPVLFDESEQNNERETARMQAVLALIRQSSSESGAKTYKGTQTGGGMQYHIRSMFCLASIQVGIQQQADRERLTVLSLREKPADSADGKAEAEGWQRLKGALYAIERDADYPRRLLHRTVRLMPVLLQSIDVFTEAAAEYFGNQRTGDQYGTLLAGAWVLLGDTAPTKEEALAAIGSFDWKEYTEPTKVNDSDRALQTLLDSQLRTAHGTQYSVFELVDRIAELTPSVMRANPEAAACTLELEQCNAVLQRYGMKVVKGRLMLGTNSEAMAKLFAGTQFAADFRGLLARVQCVHNDGEVAKINGKAIRCLHITLDDLV